MNEIFNLKILISIILLSTFASCVSVSPPVQEVDKNSHTNGSDSETSTSGKHNSQIKTESNLLSSISYKTLDVNIYLKQYPNLKSLKVFSPNSFSYSYTKDEIISGSVVSMRSDPGKNVFILLTLSDNTVIKRRVK